LTLDQEQIPSNMDVMMIRVMLMKSLKSAAPDLFAQIIRVLKKVFAWIPRI
jgi:hypothetical protein